MKRGRNRKNKREKKESKYQLKVCPSCNRELTVSSSREKCPVCKGGYKDIPSPKTQQHREAK